MSPVTPFSVMGMVLDVAGLITTPDAQVGTVTEVNAVAARVTDTIANWLALVVMSENGPRVTVPDGVPVMLPEIVTVPAILSLSPK